MKKSALYNGVLEMIKKQILEDIQATIQAMIDKLRSKNKEVPRTLFKGYVDMRGHKYKHYISDCLYITQMTSVDYWYKEDDNDEEYYGGDLSKLPVQELNNILTRLEVMLRNTR